VVRDEETAGPGLFLKTHPKSNHIWTDATLAKEEGANQTICVFKKDDFDAGANKEGTEVWTSVWDKEGEIIIYDDKTLKEIKRIKADWLVTPTGKWNVYNTVHDIY
jgi:nitrite reductase (NO-forming)/hydroxylamine reductase